MLKITLTKGLPASGKSTWAKEQVNKHPNSIKRINKDDLRAMLDDSRWSKDNEKFVIEQRDVLVIAALKRGKHVIIDDTNLAPKHEARMIEIAKEFKEAGKDVVVKVEDFTSVTPEICIERDLKRPNSVGAKVIWKMYNDFLKPEEVVSEMKKYKHDPSLPNAIICDLDGTLCQMNGRSPFEYQKCDTDKISVPVREVIAKMKNNGYKILLCSGREDSCKDKTLKWLEKHNVDYDALWMRKTGDMRKDAAIKGEIFDAKIRNKYNILFVLDDRNQMVDYWRKEVGLICFQVAEGDF